MNSPVLIKNDRFLTLNPKVEATKKRKDDGNLKGMILLNDFLEARARAWVRVSMLTSNLA